MFTHNSIAPTRLALIGALVMGLCLPGIAMAHPGHGKHRSDQDSRKQDREELKRKIDSIRKQRKRTRRTRKAIVRRIVDRRPEVKVAQRSTPTRTIRRTRTVRKVVHVHEQGPASRTYLSRTRGYNPAEDARRKLNKDAYVPKLELLFEAGLSSFATTGGSVAHKLGDSAGVNLVAGLVLDEAVTLELAWAGTVDENEKLIQASTIGTRLFFAHGLVRPYIGAGLGIFAISGPQMETVAGPGVQVSTGITLGDGPLTLGLGLDYRMIALDGIHTRTHAEDAPDLSGLALNTNLGLRF